MTLISGPIAPQRNPPINPEYYEPSRFQISAITTGVTTTITTTEDQNYVVGQLVRISLPKAFGMPQINNQQAIVLSITSSTQFVVDINSVNYNSFIATPFTATITGITNASDAVITANNNFRAGQYISISGVTGMNELNDHSFLILSCTPTTITIDEDTTTYGVYVSGGTATSTTTNTSYPQVIAVGDYNSGQINSSGISNLGTYVPGAFIDISPN